jgi:hypothetical protein
VWNLLRHCIIAGECAGDRANSFVSAESGEKHKIMYLRRKAEIQAIGPLRVDNAP